MKRLTTDSPVNNTEYMHNKTKVIDRNVYLRDYNGEGDKCLVEYCTEQCKKKCGAERTGISVEEFGEYMDCDCIVAHFYWMAVGHAELRNYLQYYENMLDLVGKVVDVKGEGFEGSMAINGFVRFDGDWMAVELDQDQEIIQTAFIEDLVTE